LGNKTENTKSGQSGILLIVTIVVLSIDQPDFDDLGVDFKVFGYSEQNGGSEFCRFYYLE